MFNLTTPPPAVSGSGSFPGAASVPSQSGNARTPWGGGSVANHPGTPHLAGHQNQPPAFGGNSPFDGPIYIDPHAVSRMNSQGFELRNQVQQLRAENRDLAQTTHELSTRPNISQAKLGELREAAKMGIEMEQRASWSQGRAIAAEEATERLTQFMDPMSTALNEGAKDLTQAKQDNKALQDKNTRLESALQKVTTELGDAQLELATKLSEVDALTSQLTSERFGNQSLNEQLDTVTRQAHTAQSSVDKLRVAKHDLENQLTELKKTNEGQDRRITLLYKEVDSGKAALRAETSTRMELEGKLDSLQRSESRLQTKLTSSESYLLRSEQQLADSQSALSDTQEQLGRTQLEVRNLNEKLSQVREGRREKTEVAKLLQAKLEEKYQALESLEAKFVDSQASVASLNQKVSEKREEVISLRHELKQSRENVKVLESKIQQQRSELSGMHELRTELDTVNRERADLDQRNQKLNGELNKVHKRDEDTQALYQDALSKNRNLDKSLKREIEAHKQHEETITSLRVEVRGLKSELATAKSEGNQEKLQQLEHEIASRDQEISHLRDMQSSSQAKIEQFEEQIGDLQIRLNDSERLSNERAVSLDRQERLMQEGEVRIEQLNAQAADFSGQLEIVQEGIDRLSREQAMTKTILDEKRVDLERCNELAQELARELSAPKPKVDQILQELMHQISVADAGLTEAVERAGRDKEDLEALRLDADSLKETVSRKSVSFEDRDHVSIRSTTSSMSETKTSGLKHEPIDVLQQRLSIDRGTMLERSGGTGTIGQDRLRETDSSVVYVQRVVGEDVPRDHSRPLHLPTGHREAIPGRHEDGITSEDDFLPRPGRQDSFEMSRDRGAVSPADTTDLLRYDLGEDDNASHASYDPASLKGYDTLDLRKMPIQSDSDSDGEV